MGEASAIGWTDDTVNVWKGCVEVSAGCKHCYAKVSTPIRVRRAAGLELWGVNGAREETQSWAQNLRRWNREALASSQRRLVFGQSIADTFEDYGGRVLRADGRVLRADGAMASSLDVLRAKFFGAIEAAPALTFQLLTKRPENIRAMVPPSWLTSWPAHVWIGCTVEDQENAERRITHLLSVPAPVRFLSVEPQIGPVDLSSWIAAIQWVICGGESGSKARPFDLAWARSLRDQCRAAGVPFFLKQLGGHPIADIGTAPDDAEQCGVVRVHLADSHGGDKSEWPADLQDCRAFPVAA